MRLIDADKLRPVTLTDGGYWTKEVFYLRDIINAPTVTPESPQWISVKDKLPEERERVLVACEDGVVRINWVECGEFPCIVNRRGKLVRTIYWMPLPQPPEEEEHNG